MLAHDHRGRRAAGGITAPLALEGTINGRSFLACVRRLLAPSLRPGDVVVLGNLGGHKVAGVRKAIEAAGAMLRHLPPFSPGSNLVEQDFSEPEALVRDAVARTTEALRATSAAPLPKPCPQDAPAASPTVASDGHGDFASAMRANAPNGPAPRASNKGLCRRRSAAERVVGC